MQIKCGVTYVDVVDVVGVVDVVVVVGVVDVLKQQLRLTMCKSNTLWW